MREVAERFRHMLKVKDCRHLCLTCEYYEICKREVNADEYEIRNEKRGHRANQCRVVGELECEPLSGIEVVVPCTERRQQKQAGGS